MLQQSLIGGKFFAVMFWLIADGLFAVVVVVVSLLPDCHLHQQCTTATCGTNNSCHCCAQNVAATFFYDAAVAAAAKTLTVNCGMPSLLDLMSGHFVRLKQVHEAVKGSRKRRQHMHAHTNIHMYEHVYDVQQLPHLVATSWTASVRIMRGLRVGRCPVDTNVH